MAGNADAPRAGGERGALTELLVAGDGSGSKRMEAVLPLVYEELRAIASRQLGREQERYSLCTTGLVHDAYLKLVDDTRVSSRGRSYFFGAAAQAMRRIIVDHARSRSRQKRGGDVHFTLLDDKELAMGEALEQIIELDDALSQLRALSPRQEQIVECRVFGGLDVVEIAEALDISQSTVKRDWAVARAWLLRQFKRGGAAEGEG
ncbi:MAG: ECF-type sigma factor [Pseudomonadota bacterium]